ncbi:hypothetical protein P9112_009192 [Eukaryota sp. TZLM1-RC]
MASHQHGKLKAAVISDGGRRFKFHSFNQSVRSLRVSGSYKTSSHSSDALLSTKPASLDHSYTQQALVKWSDLDCTFDFKSLHSYLTSLPSITSENFDDVINHVITPLTSPSLLSPDSFLAILCALTQDFPELLAAKLGLILHQICSPLDDKLVLPARIETTFRAISIIFRMISFLANSELMTCHGDVIIELLGKKHDYLRNLFAQSFAALFRSMKVNGDVISDLIMTLVSQSKTELTDNFFCGFSTFLFELIKSSSPHFHSKSFDIISNLVNFEPITSSFPLFFDLVANHGNAETITPFFELFISKPIIFMTISRHFPKTSVDFYPSIFNFITSQSKLALDGQVDSSFIINLFKIINNSISLFIDELLYNLAHIATELTLKTDLTWLSNSVINSKTSLFFITVFNNLIHYLKHEDLIISVISSLKLMNGFKVDTNKLSLVFVNSIFNNLDKWAELTTLFIKYLLSLEIMSSDLNDSFINHLYGQLTMFLTQSNQFSLEFSRLCFFISQLTCACFKDEFFKKFQQNSRLDILVSCIESLKSNNHNHYFIATLTNILRTAQGELTTESLTTLTKICSFSDPFITYHSLKLLSLCKWFEFNYNDEEGPYSDLIGIEYNMANDLLVCFENIFDLSGRNFSSNIGKIVSHVEYNGLNENLIELLVTCTVSFFKISFTPAWQSCQYLLVTCFRSKFRNHSINLIGDHLSDLTSQSSSQQSHLIDDLIDTIQIVPNSDAVFKITSIEDQIICILKTIDSAADVIRSNIKGQTPVQNLFDRLVRILTESFNQDRFKLKVFAWLLRCFSSIGGLSVKEKKQKGQKATDMTLPAKIIETHTQSLTPIFDRFLSHPDPSIQYLAIRCLGCYTLEHERIALRSVLPNLSRIVSEDTFRTELTSFDVSESSTMVTLEVRKVILPRLLSILIGRLFRKGGHYVMNIDGVNPGAKINQSRVRSIITSFLTGLNDLDPFFNQIVLPFTHANLIPVPSPTQETVDQLINLIPVSVSIGFLNMLQSIYAHLGRQSLTWLFEFFKLKFLIMNATFVSNSVYYSKGNQIKGLFWNRIVESFGIFVAFFERFSHCFEEIFTGFLNISSKILTDDVSFDRLISISPKFYESLFILSSNSTLLSLLIRKSDLIVKILELPLKSTTMAQIKLSTWTLKILQMIINQAENDDVFSTFLRDNSELITSAMINLLFTSKVTRKRLNSKHFLEHLNILMKMIPFMDSKNTDAVLESICPVVVNCSTESVASMLLEVTSKCLITSSQSLDTSPFLTALPKLFMVLRSRDAVLNLVSVYNSITCFNSSFYSIITDLNSFCENGDVDHATRSSACQQIVDQIKHSQNDLFSDPFSTLPIIYSVLQSLIISNDIPLRQSCSFVLTEFISFASSHEVLRHSVLLPILAPLIRSNCNQSNKLVRAEFLVLFRQLIRLPSAPNSVSGLKLFTSDAVDSCPIANLGHVQNHSKFKALKQIAKIFESNQSNDVTQANLTQFFVPVVVAIISDCVKNSDQGLIEGVSELLPQICRRLVFKNYYSFLLKLLRAINNPGKVLRRRVREEEIKVLESNLMTCVDHVIMSWHFELFEKTEEQTTPMETDDVIDSDDDVTDDDSDSETESETESESEVEQKREDSMFKNSDHKSSIISNQQAFDCLLRRILPLLLRLLRYKPKTDTTIEKKKSRRNRGISRAPLAKSYASLLLLLPDDMALTKLPRLVHLLVDALRDEEQATRDKSRDALAKVVLRFEGKYLDSVVRTIKKGLERGFDRHVATYTIHHILSKLMELESDYSDWLDLIVSDVLELVFEEIIGGVGEEKNVTSLAQKGRESGAKISFDLIRVLASRINFSSSTVMISTLSTAAKSVTSLDQISRLESLASSLISGFLNSTTATTADLFSFVYCLLHWNDYATNVPTVVKFSKLYGFKDGKSVIQRSEHSTHSLDDLFANTIERPTYETTFKIPPTVDFSYVKTTCDSERAMSLITFIAGSLLVGTLKKKIIDQSFSQTISTLLTDLVSTVTANTSSKDIIELFLKSVNLALKRQDLEFDSETLSPIANLLMDFLRRGVNNSLRPSLAKALAAMLERTGNDEEKEGDYDLIVNFCRTKLIDSKQIDVGLGLVKSIVFKGKAQKEVSKLMGKQSIRILLTSPMASSRKLMGEILAYYLTREQYKVKNQSDLIGILVGNLGYDLDSGREAVVECLYLLIENFSMSQVSEFYGVLFMSLALQISKEKVFLIKEMMQSTGVLLCERLRDNFELFDTCVDYARQWLNNEDENTKFVYQNIGLIAIKILVKSTQSTDKWSRHHSEFMALISELMTSSTSTAFALWILIRDLQSDLMKEFKDHKANEEVFEGQDNIERIKGQIVTYKSRLDPLIDIIIGSFGYLDEVFKVLPIAHSHEILVDSGPLLLTCLRFFDRPQLLGLISSIFSQVLAYRDNKLNNSSGSRDSFLSTPGVIKVVTSRIISSLPSIYESNYIPKIIECLMQLIHISSCNPELSIDSSSKSWIFYQNSFEIKVRDEVPSFMRDLITNLEFGSDDIEKDEIEFNSSNAVKLFIIKLTKMARHPKSPDKLRFLIVKLISVLINQYEEFIVPFLRNYLEALSIITDDTGGLQISQETRDVATEVVESLRKRSESGLFISTLSEIQTERAEMKRKRQQERDVLTIVDPAEAARQTLNRTKGKRENRKRKAEENKMYRNKVSIKLEPEKKRRR